MAAPRDEFGSPIVRALQERVGNHCSNPNCQCLTSGPNFHPEKASRIGVAAHVTAAAPGGPRFDSTISSDERSSIHNGIWLCQNCAKLVDADPLTYGVPVLVEWRNFAETNARRQIEGGGEPPGADPEGWSCPHCGTTVQDGLTVCLGCDADVVYGSTRDEQAYSLNVGLVIGGFPSALLMYWLPSWISSTFSLSIPPGFGLGVYSVVPVLLCALGAAYLSEHYEDALHRRSPPRFVRHTKA
jgi:hypothetical protein